ncbi:MAG: NADH-quinone oxidoreductase subunit K [Planctomycetes bacterium RBG_16_59_8]|nr:MAG: NADH-quinone oxidoreductase subunit K [Planctomycetes bacterium RBG_16_59_8]
MYWFTEYPLEHFLFLGAILFCAGIYTILTRKNAVSILMGVELVLNAGCLNFIAFSAFGKGSIDGNVFALFVIVLAAAEAAVALAIIIGIYKNFGKIDVDEVDTMKG